MRPMWRKFLRRFRAIALFCCLLLLGKLVWFCLEAPPIAGQNAAEVRADLAARRAYLLYRVANPQFGVADMPALVASPYRQELAIATLSMTTVALTNLAFRDPTQRIENLDAVRAMISRMMSDEIRRYDVIWWGEDALDSLDGSKGHVGYLGHLNLMLGCFFLLGGEDVALGELHERVSATLARRLGQSGYFHAETFPGWIYTADNVVVIHSLRLHDLVSTTLYAGLVRGWLDYSKQHLLDTRNGMLRYHVSRSGQAEGTARGVLQSWNSIWLPLIDPDFARDQYLRMKRNLFARSGSANFVAVREYPTGQTGPTDLVSGPLIFGLSPTATGFGMAGAAYWSDEATLTGLLRTAELAGFTWTFRGRRRYLLAPLLGDSIILAARTATRWDDRFLTSPTRR